MDGFQCLCLHTPCWQIQVHKVHQQRGDAHQRQRQLPVYPEQVDGRGQEHDHAVDRRVIDIAQEMTAPVRIGGHTGHQITGAVAVKEAGILVLQAGEEPHAQVVDDVLAALFQRDHHKVARTLAEHAHRQHGEEDPQQGLGILRHDDVIHQLLLQRGVDQQHQRGHCADAQGQDVPLVVLPVHDGP